MFMSKSSVWDQKDSSDFGLFVPGFVVNSDLLGLLRLCQIPLPDRTS